MIVILQDHRNMIAAIKMDTVGIPTVQKDRQGYGKSNTSFFLPYLILSWDTIINTCYVSLTCGIDEID